MKFTDKKVLSLPPYISTLWSNVISLQLEYRSSGHVLVIELKTGSKVEVPNLEAKMIEELFATHADIMRLEAEGKHNEKKTDQQGFTFPFGIFESMSSILQHNPQQANTPVLPSEILEKIAMMFKGVVPEDVMVMGKAEIDCNCMYCQIMRAIVGFDSSQPSHGDVEEEITEKDLQFRDWNIEQSEENLFVVTNPFDMKEKYTVFLGHPIGCTCGNKNCEHIQAVLRS